MIARTETADEKSYRIIDLRNSYGDGWSEGNARTSAGVRVTAETALECSTVLACVRLIAENVATVPLHVYRRLPEGGKERARDCRYTGCCSNSQTAGRQALSSEKC
jgi:phage portal protein BeeE